MKYTGKIYRCKKLNYKTPLEFADYYTIGNDYAELKLDLFGDDLSEGDDCALLLECDLGKPMYVESDCFELVSCVTEKPEHSVGIAYNKSELYIYNHNYCDAYDIMNEIHNSKVNVLENHIICLN